MTHILIIGGGTGGIMTAAQLLKKGNVKVMLLEPAEFHYYQPAWTLVGSNTYNFEKTKRTMASVMPDGVNWVKEFADKFDPANNSVITTAGTEINYDYLVVSPGIKIDPSLVEGLSEAMDKGVVCSNYTGSSTHLGSPKKLQRRHGFIHTTRNTNKMWWRSSKNHVFGGGTL